MSTPATFYDDNGVVRLQGSLVGGGGSQPVIDRAVYLNVGGYITPEHFATGGLMNWEYASGDALLDLSDTAHPTMVAAGLYAVTAWVYSYGNASIAARSMLVDLAVAQGESGDPGAEAISQAPLSETFSQGADCAVPLTYYFKANGGITLGVTHDDPAGFDFFHQTTIQRLSGPAT